MRRETTEGSSIEFIWYRMLQHEKNGYINGRLGTNISNIKISFVIIPGTFWRNLTKIGQNYIPYKFAQSGFIPPKIKCEILGHRGSPKSANKLRSQIASWVAVLSATYSAYVVDNATVACVLLRQLTRFLKWNEGHPYHPPNLHLSNQSNFHWHISCNAI